MITQHVKGFVCPICKSKSMTLNEYETYRGGLSSLPIATLQCRVCNLCGTGEDAHEAYSNMHANAALHSVSLAVKELADTLRQMRGDSKPCTE